MASCLPDNPSLDRLRADARRLQRGVRAGDPDALDLVQRWHPRAEDAAAQEFPLHAAQLTVARRYGFTGWPALVGYLEVAARLTRHPGSVDEHSLSAADRFCALACLRYDQSDEPPRWASAAALLAEHPGIVDEHIWAAAAAADPAAVRRHLRSDGASVRADGGPYRWVPLLYLTYSRVPGTSETDVLATASALLEAGADVNAGYLWGGQATPFTALTGAFGEGEQGPGRQPRRPHSSALARLLLERGADPNDGQALYNRMFTRDNRHLELLFEFGLGSGDSGPWRRRLGEALESPAHMLRRQLDWAIDHQLTERVRLLAQHRIDLVTPSADGLTPRDRAHALAFFPVTHELVLGGTMPSVGGKDEVAQAAAILLAGPDQDVHARAWLSSHPELVAGVKQRWPEFADGYLPRHQDALDRLSWAGFDVGGSQHAVGLRPSAEASSIDRDSRHEMVPEVFSSALESGELSLVFLLMLGGRDADDEAKLREYLLRDRGTEILARDRERHPALIHRASDAIAIDRIAWAGFDVNIKLDGHTALHQAAWDGDLAKVSALLAAGADPNVTDDEHQGTPLAWAEYAYQSEAADLLRGVTPPDPDVPGT
ncbi:ankyrin repeat domain-containing protein [Nakamurella lactea]|uniref:ankyrin repeat domain-containing protein n=1 Tax=Nakamurella lactea TaxID=459515 RepID=UPI000413641C|nr:ankyrin repeat domain-containing protein [Nakamurella lactea]